MGEWIKSEELIDFSYSLDWMEKRAVKIFTRECDECVWLLEHPPIYTAGTSSKITDLKDPDRFPVIKTSRGGQYTFHGPGQRVVYVMLNLNKRDRDIKKYIRNLEMWIIKSLANFDIIGETRSDRVGIWVSRSDKPLEETGKMREDKIAAIGVRLKKWVTFHGISINVNPNLSHFEGIVPCGISNHGVTSFEDLGKTNVMSDLDKSLMETFNKIF